MTEESFLKMTIGATFIGLVILVAGSIAVDLLVPNYCEYVEDRVVSQRGIMGEVSVYNCLGFEFFISGWD